MTPKWEYKKTFGEAGVEAMDALGANGWENYWNVFDPYGRIDVMFWKRQIP